MMKRFSIEIIDHGLSKFNLKDKVIISKEYYTSFFRSAFKLGLCYDIMKNVSIKCATCNSYIVDLHILYDVIEEVLASPDCKDPFNIFGCLQDKLEQGYDWWNVEYDWWDAEVAIIFDRDCTCHQMFVGKPQEQEIEDGQIDFHNPHGRVLKYVGPKRYWS